MLAGQCDAGKSLDRKVTQGFAQAMAPEMIDQIVDGHAARYCTGAAPKSAEDRAHKYAMDLNRANTEVIPLATCVEAFRGLKAARAELLKGGVAPGSLDDRVRTDFLALGNAGLCLGKAGDCAAGWSAFREIYPARERAKFDHDVPRCKGK
jgi:hypothetical protein